MCKKSLGGRCCGNSIQKQIGRRGRSSCWLGRRSRRRGRRPRDSGLVPKHRWPRPLLTVAVISIGAVAVMGCTAQSGRTSVDASEPGPVSAGASAAATPNLPVRDVELRLPAAGAFPPGWTRDFAVPYGAASDQLGVAPDHGGAATPWGPEFAAPGRDGTWWVLDVQKSRVARYGRTGGFLGETPIPRPNPDVRAPRILGDWLYA